MISKGRKHPFLSLVTDLGNAGKGLLGREGLLRWFFAVVTFSGGPHGFFHLILVCFLLLVTVYLAIGCPLLHLRRGLFADTGRIHFSSGLARHRVHHLLSLFLLHFVIRSI